MPVNYSTISTALAKAKVSESTEAFELDIIQEMMKGNEEAVFLAIDYYFNNDNYPEDYRIENEVQKFINS